MAALGGVLNDVPLVYLIQMHTANVFHPSIESVNLIGEGAGFLHSITGPNEFKVVLHEVAKLRRSAQNGQIVVRPLRFESRQGLYRLGLCCDWMLVFVEQRNPLGFLLSGSSVLERELRALELWIKHGRGIAEVPVIGIADVTECPIIRVLIRVSVDRIGVLIESGIAVPYITRNAVVRRVGIGRVRAVRSPIPEGIAAIRPVDVFGAVEDIAVVLFGELVTP